MGKKSPEVNDNRNTIFPLDFLPFVPKVASFRFHPRRPHLWFTSIMTQLGRSSSFPPNLAHSEPLTLNPGSPCLMDKSPLCQYLLLWSVPAGHTPAMIWPGRSLMAMTSLVGQAVAGLFKYTPGSLPHAAHGCCCIPGATGVTGCMNFVDFPGK